MEKIHLRWDLQDICRFLLDIISGKPGCATKGPTGRDVIDDVLGMGEDVGFQEDRPGRVHHADSTSKHQLR